MNIACVIFGAVGIAIGVLSLLCSSISKDRWIYEGKLIGFRIGYVQGRKDERLDHKDEYRQQDLCDQIIKTAF